MKKTIFITALILACFQLNAQYERAKHGLGFRLVNTNFHYPITNEFSTMDFAGIGLEMEYVRHLNDYLNLSVPFRMNKGYIPLDDKGRFQTMSLASLDAALQLKLFKEPNFIYPYLYAGVRGISEDHKGDFSFAAPLGLGLNFRVFRHSYISFKGEYALGFQENRNHLQAAAGVLVLLGGGAGTPAPPAISDRDNDGIADTEDLCPDVAGIAGLNGCPDKDGDGVTDGEDECPEIAGIKALAGCPDTDSDGIADQKDECPNEPGPMDNNGCPRAKDADMDGIPDNLDNCPEVAGVASANGCPDKDGDGVADKDDECPDNAGPSDTNGCPDTDNDGVLDRIDKCPEQAGPVANNGCPELSEEDKEVLNFAVQAVQFETASSTLKSESYDVLNKIVDIMKRNPAHKLTISGHTDSVGSSSDNQRLSENRARACYDYLLSKGVKAYRMTYKGFGETVPIADNKYKAGRDKNRRVEFLLFID